MTAGNRGSRERPRRFAAAVLSCALCWHFGALARAAEYELVAATKVQVAIVQWSPSKGEYQRWDALGGTFLVSPEGTLELPVVGSLHVSDKTSAEVAARISAGLREKMGLLAAPEVTVEIAEYPPFYVVGAVTSPGAYPFRPGLTVLQALAVAGGRYRPSADRTGQNEITLGGDLAAIQTDKLRLIGRMARLQAEIAGESEVRFPPELTDDGGKLASEVIALERTLFAVRANETKRQLTKLAELGDMYTSEIQMLDVKGKDSNKEITQTEEEVTGLTKLVEKGIAPISRWSEVRRILGQMRAAHSDDNIAALRARQSLSDTTRQEFGIRDQRQTEVATQLQDAQGDLDRLKSREQTLRRLLLSDGIGSTEETPEASFVLRFTVVRNGQSESAEMPASESTQLLPGDVLKVEVEMPVPTGVSAGPVASVAHPGTSAARAGQ